MDFSYQFRAPDPLLPPSNDLLELNIASQIFKSSRIHRSFAKSTLSRSCEHIKARLEASPLSKSGLGSTSVSVPDWGYTRGSSSDLNPREEKWHRPKLKHRLGYTISGSVVDSEAESRSYYCRPHKPYPLKSNSKVKPQHASSKVTPDFLHSSTSLQFTSHTEIPDPSHSDELNRRNLPDTTLIDFREDLESHQFASRSLDVSSFLLTLFPLPPQYSHPVALNSDHRSTDSREHCTPLANHQESTSLEIIDCYTSSTTFTDTFSQAPNTFYRSAQPSCPTIEVKGLKANAIMSFNTTNTCDTQEAPAQSTPSRAIFDDLPSAYKKITSRPFSETVVSVELPLPPVPLPTRTRPFLSDNLQNSLSSPDGVIVQPSPSYDATHRSHYKLHSDHLVNCEHSISQVEAAHRRESCASSAFVNTNIDRSQALPMDSLVSLTETASSKFTQGQHYYDDDSIFDQSSRVSHDSHTINLDPLRTQPSIDISLRSASSNQEETHVVLSDSQEDGAKNGMSFKEKLSLYENRSNNTKEHFQLARRHSDNTEFQVPSGERTTSSGTSTIENLLEHYHRQSGSFPSLTWQGGFRDEQIARKQTMSVRSPVKQLSVEKVVLFAAVGDKAIGNAGGDIVRSSHDLKGLPVALPLSNNPSTPTQARVIDRATTTECIPSVDYGKTQDASRQEYSSSVEIGRFAEPNILAHQHHDDHELASNISSTSSVSNSELGDGGRVGPSPSEDYLRRTLSYVKINGSLPYDAQRISGLTSAPRSGEASYPMGDKIVHEHEEAYVEQDVSPVRTSWKGDSEIRYTRCILEARIQKDDDAALRLPSADSDHSGSVPGFWRLSMTERTKLEKIVSSGPPSPILRALEIFEDGREGDGNESIEEHDWETIPESRPTLRSLTPYSLGDVSSPSSGFSFNEASVHPGDPRYHHSYRLQAVPASNGFVFVPSYKFVGDAGFPNRNALMEPERVVVNKAHQHPKPWTPSPTNPFVSSSPVALGSPQGNFAATRSEEDLINTLVTPQPCPLSWHRPALSVVYEQVNESTQGTVTDFQGDDSSPVSTSSAMPHGGRSNEWLASGFRPGTESSSIFPNRIRLKSKPPSEFASHNDVGRSSSMLRDAIKAKMMKKLRQDDSRMASTPLTANNSFSQFTTLGPLVNLTGTPNGTNMHEVGSSMVGSGSSPYQFVSSPPVLETNTPKVPLNVHQSIARSFPLVADPNSPLAEYDERHYGIPRRAFRTAAPCLDTKFREEMLAASQSDMYPRRSVPSQKRLLEMNLIQQNGDIVLTTASRVRDPYDRPSRRPQSIVNTRPWVPLIERPTLLPSPRLLEIYHPSSSEAASLRARKNKLSWAVFAMCTVLPPLLVLYGFGYLDGLMFLMSRRAIEHFGRTQKKVAKWVGILGTITIISAIVIFWIIIKTVPNNLSR